MQEEEQKENVMGLADTNWLKSPPLSTPARPPFKALTDNPADVAAAASRENMSADNDAAGHSRAPTPSPRLAPPPPPPPPPPPAPVTGLGQSKAWIDLKLLFDYGNRQDCACSLVLYMLMFQSRFSPSTKSQAGLLRCLEAWRNTTCE